MHCISLWGWSMRFGFRLVICSFLLIYSGLVYAQEQVKPEPVSIIRVTPEGQDVQGTRQIVIEFNRPIVPIGKMERTQDEVGVTISPRLDCEWRWLNTTSLSCNLSEAEAMKSATAYIVQIMPKIKAADGGILSEPLEHKFITQRPLLSYSNFKTWRSPSMPVIRLVFDQAVSKSSVSAHIFFKTQAQSRIPVIVLPDMDDRELPEYLPTPDGKGWIKIENDQTQKSDNTVTQVNGDEARRVWLVEPKEELPVGEVSTLESEAGIIAAEGDQAGVQTETLVQFKTFSKFEFLGVRCSDAIGESILISPGSNPLTEKLRCNPMRPVSLAFSSPVLQSRVRDYVLFTPDLAGGRKDFKPWGEENRDYSMLDRPASEDGEYRVLLPIGLKADQKYKIEIPAATSTVTGGWVSAFFGAGQTGYFEDEFARQLQNPVQFEFATDNRNPNFEMAYNDAVLEKNVDSEVPLYVNNLNSYDFNYRRITADKIDEGQAFHRDVANIKNIQYGIPLGVRDMLGRKSGIIYGNLATQPYVNNKGDYAYRLFAQVTPWQAHVKLGHFSSLVWVTDMATGKPVEGVDVSIFSGTFSELTLPKSVAARAVTNKDGMAELPGSSVLDPTLVYANAWEDSKPRLFVYLKKGEDVGLLPISSAYQMWVSGYSNYSVYEQAQEQYGHLKSWGFTAQGIYRAGDTMQYKIFLRDQNNKKLILPPTQAKYKLRIYDPQGKLVDVRKGIKFTEFGAYAGEYKIPENAVTGWYDFKLDADFTKEQADASVETSSATETSEEEQQDFFGGGRFTLYPLRVLVSDFTPAPFRVSVEMNGDLFRPDDELSIETTANLHSGGPYGDAAVRTTLNLTPRYFSSKDPVAKDFTFSTYDEGFSQEQLLQNASLLDEKGVYAEKFILPQHSIYYGELYAEGAVQDDRGKSIAGSDTAKFMGVDRFVGLYSPLWFYESGKPAKIQTLVVNEDGKASAGTAVAVDIQYEDVNIAKVKGAGNSYISDITREWKSVGSCSNTSGVEPQVCSFIPEKAGSYKMIASIKDQKGRDHRTVINLWVSGDNYVQWNDQNENALSIIPERSDYKAGDTAKFLVKNPFPGAKALVTVERYGILDQFVTSLDGGAPVIEIPVKPDYIPGFYLSVVLVSPRVEMPPPELGQVDMGKPSFRLGYVSVPVFDTYKEMDVKVSVASEVYRPRDLVKVSLNAVPKKKSETQEPVEVAVAVLDEAVFDLISSGRDAFDPYKAFYGLDALDVRNYGLINALVGRQKFEKKGANAGGDGGSDLDVRNIFKFVSYWNPSLRPDEDGNVEFEFDAPDNLTGWRVLAVATTPSDRMGLGEGSFKVNRPTEIRPVMPNQVREGDIFSAGFSVMNRTDAPRTLTVRIEASGDIQGTDGVIVHEEKVELSPYKRKTVYLPVTAGLLKIERTLPKGSIHFSASAGDDVDLDGLEHDIPVYKSRIIDVGATYGASDGESVEESVAVPSGIYTDTGDISVTLSPSVIANISGAFKYMRDYPYPCWEQVLSRSVMASGYVGLKDWISGAVEWDGAARDVQSGLDAMPAYQAPNGGMAYFIARDENVDPYLSAYTGVVLGWMEARGYTVQIAAKDKLHDYLLNLLRQDVAPSFYDEGMKSSVRAVALEALARAGKAKAEDVQRYQQHVKGMSLFGQAHFVMAASRFKETSDAAREALGIIFSKGSESGGKFSYSETLDDGYLRILSTPVRDNCAVMSAFMAYAKSGDKKAQALIGDAPMKLARYITQSRGNRDHFENTQENVFCVNALMDYVTVYESVKPDMKISVALDKNAMGPDVTFKDVKDKPVRVSHAIQAEDEGKTKVLNISKEGKGRYYYQALIRYAEKPEKHTPVNAGIDVQREYSIKSNQGWRILKPDAPLKRGDLIKVDLFISIPTARNFVVVDDPLPGGLETVNRDLATASSVDDAQAQYDQQGGSLWFKYNDWQEFSVGSYWNFYNREMKHDAVRFYADYLTAGNYHLSYMAQVISDGTFSALPTRAEEMYDPDIYGRGSGAELTIKTAQ